MKKVLQIALWALVIYVPCLILSTVIFLAGFTVGWAIGFGGGAYGLNLDSIIAYGGVFSPVVIFSLGTLLFYRKIKSFEISKNKCRLLSILFLISFPLPMLALLKFVN